MTGTITSIAMFLLAPASAVYLTDWYWRYRAAPRRYMAGIKDGQKLETEWARRDAVEAERMRVSRLLHDNGRRHHPRPGAEPARVHRAQVGLRRPGQM